MGKFHLLATALVLSVLSAPSARSQTKTEITPSPPATAAESETDAPVTDCDKYAASPLDPERKTDGVTFGKINLALAVPACESALAQYPNSTRLIYQLGRAYHQQKNFISAVIEYRKAAERGSLAAQVNLSNMYGLGEGVAKDSAEAARWIRKPADKGLPVAQSNLGSMYLNGEGVEKDYIQAERWTRKAADQGLSLAQLNLGEKTFAGPTEFLVTKKRMPSYVLTPAPGFSEVVSCPLLIA
jgi:tetratricopeptide (TPR) repeat protein